jgi:H+/Cl- antiporter ClcA
LVLSLSSSFLHFFFPVSAGFICKKMKAKTKKDDELVRLVVLLRLPFLLICAAAGAVGGVVAAALPPGVAAGF